MIIIAFSNKTSKVIPHILCRKYKHVAPIVPSGNELTMYQFVNYRHVEKIKLNMRDIKILKAHGWEFIYINGIALPHDFNPYHTRTCVDLTKRAIGLKNLRIQTPSALYKNLTK